MKTPNAERLRTKTLQSAVMAVEKAMGANIKEIAQRWEVSEASVRSRLGEVSSLGFFKAFEEALLSRLVPQAIAVVEAHLQMGNYDAARDLLHGLGVLSRSAPLRAVETSASTDPANPASLAEWRARKADSSALAAFKKVN